MYEYKKIFQVYVSVNMSQHVLVSRKYYIDELWLFIDPLTVTAGGLRVTPNVKPKFLHPVK